MASLFPNHYYLRKVAASSAKPCLVCYKAIDSVLVTSDNKDFFYTCPKHLQDRNFAIPVESEQPLNDATKKAGNKEAKPDEKGGDVKKVDIDTDKFKDTKEEAAKAKDVKDEAEKTRDEKKSDEREDLPLTRIYSLHRNFYNQRLERLRQTMITRQTQARMKDQSFFPSVPNNPLP